jgi:hypothetical protein
LLTVQDDPGNMGRMTKGLLLLAVGTLTGFSASSTLHGGGGLIHVGLGRLVDYLTSLQVPGIWLLGFIERVHIGGMLVVAALLLLFGRSRRPQPGPHEMLVFYRRASARRAYALLAGGAVLLVLGAWVAARFHPLLAGVIELPATTLLGVALGYCVLPEFRPALAVYCDSRSGFGNRIEVSGGPFNRLGRLVVRHDHLGRVAIVEPDWTRLLQYRDLQFEYLDQGKRYTVLIEAVGPERELSVLQGYLSGAFHYAQTPAAVQWAGAMQRQFE